MSSLSREIFKRHLELQSSTIEMPSHMYVAPQPPFVVYDNRYPHVRSRPQCDKVSAYDDICQKGMNGGYSFHVSGSTRKAVSIPSPSTIE